MPVTHNRGFTLIELMIALLITAILVAGGYSLLITQQRTYILQDQVVGVQQDARAALTIMARDIRMAAMMTDIDGFNINGVTEAITPTNNTAVPDQIRVVYAAEEVSVVSVVNSGALQVTLDPGGGNRFDTSTRRFVAFEGVNHVYEIAPSGISGDTLTLTEPPLAYLDDFSARVYCIKVITYNVSGTALQRNDGSGNQVLAGAGNESQVEDLQFAYQVEGDTITWYNTPAEAGVSNTDIRAVRINLLVRTAVEDPDDQNYQRPGLEDRTGSGTKDGYRRRVYTTVIKLRNV
jgi:prepilin-type N-terminal cleavage/methylation domain-containing protein